MTGQYTDNLYDDLKNKKRAYRGMCAVVILLFVFDALAAAVTFVAGDLLYGNGYDSLQAFLVSFIKLFGVGNATAVSAARRLITSGAFGEFLNMLITVLTLALPTAVFGRIVKVSSDECFPMKGKLVKGFLALFGAMQLFVMFTGSFSTSLYDFFFPDSTVDPGGFTDFSGYEFDGYMLLLRVISVCIFVPIVEEFIFRGVIFSYLRRYGTMFGVFASALIFGVAHSNPSQSVYALVFGLFSCFLTAVTGNIKTSVLFHAINNFISIMYEQLAAYASENMLSAISCLVNIAVAFAGFAGFYLIAKKGGLADDFMSLCKKETDSDGLCAGMKEIMVVPLLVYILIYAVSVVTAAV